MEENLTKGVYSIIVFHNEKLDSRKYPAEGGAWTHRTSPLVQPHSPEVQTRKPHAQLLFTGDATLTGIILKHKWPGRPVAPLPLGKGCLRPVFPLAAARPFPPT